MLSQPEIFFSRITTIFSRVMRHLLPVVPLAEEGCVAGGDGLVAVVLPPEGVERLGEVAVPQLEHHPGLRVVIHVHRLQEQECRLVRDHNYIALQFL